MNFLPHEPHSARAQTGLLAALLVLGAGLIAIAVLTSPWLLVAAALAGLVTWGTWREPMWTVLFLSAWWPFEPFVLKFVSDELYLYARFFSEILVYILIAVVILGVLTGKWKRRSTPITLPMALFCLMIGVSIVLNVLPIGQALLGVRQMIRFMLLFFAVVWRYPRRYWMKRFVFLLFVVAGLQACIGVTQAVVGGSLDQFLLPSEQRTYGEIQLTEGTVQFWDPGQRVFATMGRYDRLGTFLGLVMLLAFGLLYEEERPRVQWSLIGLMCVAFPALILTYSRSAWFGVVLGVLAIAAIHKDRRVFTAAGIAAACFAAYLGLAGLSTTLADTSSQTVSERFLEAFTYQRFRGEYLGLGRVYWMVQTPLVVVPYSLTSALFGWGPAQYGAGAVAAIGNTRVYDRTGLPFGIHGTEGYIDNNWFALWGETGTLGMLFYLWLYLVLMALGYRLAREGTTAFSRGLGAAYVGMALSVALNAGLATFLEVRTLAPYLWMSAAFVVVLAGRERVLDVTWRPARWSHPTRADV